MDCIPYINDLLIEIDTLEKINKNDPEINLKIDQKKKMIEECKNNLSRLSKKNIEYRIYLYYLNGMSINKAIQKVADENYKNDIKPFTERAIYKNYYQNLKKIIKIH